MAESLNDGAEIAPGANSPGPATKKVELDLDDAPFLQTDEPPPPPVPVEDESPAPDADDGNAKRKKKKLLIIAAGCALLLVALAVAWWFFFRTPPPPPAAPLEPEVIVVPNAATNTGPGEIVRDFAPFVVPVSDDMKATSFLVCKFSAITKDPAVNQEMDRQRVPLRDAIYYYLRGKDADFLLDARNGEAIKRDLLSVFNDYLTQGKLEDIVFESYLSR